jgi:hypothetical protein
MVTRKWELWMVGFVIFAAIAAGPAPSTIHVVGSAVKTGDWSVDQLQTQLASQIKAVDYNSRGGKHTFHCVPLIAVLQAAGVSGDFAMNGAADPKIKNPQMRQVVLVRGRDGYAVVFSMAEVLPMVGNRAVWVALDEDGAPLDDSAGPVRLIVPDDQMPSRGVHQVDSIEVIDVGSATTQPVN